VVSGTSVDDASSIDVVTGAVRATAAVARTAAGLAWGAVPARWSRPVASRSRWSEATARTWRERTGWLVGCNFIPSTAGNQLEMWQADTFDPATIDRELGWAAALGFNAVRVFLHDLAWSGDGPGFLDRLDRMLDLAAGHGIALMPVLFDGIWHPAPRPGRQPEPRPGIHNSTWLQSPGAAVVADPARWDVLRPYVDAVVGRFGADPRVVVWDLFNEPDAPNLAYARAEPVDKAARVAGLVDRVFDWAQALDPDQPLTVGVHMGIDGAVERVDRLHRTALARSDVVSFHSYSPRARLEGTIDHLAAYRRPLLCTEWMARTTGSTVDLLEVLARHDVGAFCWGLVDGRTQTRYPWTSWLRPATPSTPWFHELLEADGRPHDPTEAELIRRITARARPGVV
jgi:hypothetical protein